MTDPDLHDLAVADLRALLGVVLDQPEAELNTPYPREDAPTRFADGRVALLFCVACASIECGALSAEIVFEDDLVQWRDIAWQDGHVHFCVADQELPVFSASFDRAQYVELLGKLLEERAS